MKKISLILFALVFSLIAFSQADYLTIKSFITQKGKFTVYHYVENIYKIKFEPEGYKNGEQISEAVILKVPFMMGHPFEVEVNDDTIFLKGQPVIVGTHETDGYRGFYFPLRNDEMIFGGGESFFHASAKESSS